jgi:hypothetical protein
MRKPISIAARWRAVVPLGVVVVVLAAGLAASIGAQQTASGKVTAAVFFGLIIALCLVGLARMNRNRDHIDVTPEAISYRRGRRGGVSLTLSRDPGSAEPADLRIIPRLSDHGFKAPPRLTLVGSGMEMSLVSFSTRRVRRGCEAAGWRFGNGSTEQGASDLRDWYRSGRVIEGAQIVDLFGPYDTDVDNDGTTSLGAAVLESYADRLFEADHAAARAAYLRAAEAQRSYAAYATSGGEGIARMAEADRLTAKANS